MTIATTAHQSPSMTREATRVHTGRTFKVDEVAETIRTLVQLPPRELDANQLALDIASDLRQTPLPLVSLGEAVFFRGRPSDGVKRAWEDMGPPPPNCKVDSGRYNRLNQRVLYLASTVEGVRREARPGLLCVQRYQLKDVRIADLGHESIPHRVNVAFDVAENVGRNDSVNSTGCEFTWFLADALHAAGYDGFSVPGVRGDAAIRYSNLIVFEPESRWRDWSLKDIGFQRD